MITVTGLHIYPVKGLAGIACQEARLTSFGLAYDRYWMIVDRQGQFVSQREIPALARIRTRLSDEALQLSASGNPDLHIPLVAGRLASRQGVVWRTACEVLDEGLAASKWLCDVLGEQDNDGFSLVRMAPGFRREILDSPWTDAFNTSTRFADAYPILVTSEATLDTLNRQIESGGNPRVPMNRFRPNIVISGYPALAEYQGPTLRMVGGDAAITLCKPCERCKVTTVDQFSGEVVAAQGEPLRSLIAMDVVQGSHKPFFGMNAVLAGGDGCALKVGDELWAEG